MRAVLVPIRSFEGSKMRLAPRLEAPDRARLMRELAGRVLAAAQPLEVAVACEDDEVADFASAHGALVIRTPGLGLSGSVQAGVEHLAEHGYDVVTVAHGDLGLARDLVGSGRDAGSGGEAEVTVVPDRRLDGTNVISVPVGKGFAFAYGAGSFGLHRAEAARVGLACRTIYDWELSVDVDLPEDLDLLNLARQVREDDRR